MSLSIDQFSQKSSIIDEFYSKQITHDTTGFIPGDSLINIHTLGINTDSSYIGIILLILMLLISAIWFFAPHIIKGSIVALADNPLKRKWESGANTAGLIINTLLYINYIVVVPVLIILIFNSFTPDYLSPAANLNTLFTLIIILFGFLLFRLAFVSTTAWLFATKAMGKAHNKLFNSMEKTLGIIILPLLFISIYTNSSFFIALGGLIILLFMLSRWILTMAIGLRITKFSWFHIILYLCTLEIIPFLMVIKFMRSQVFM